MYYFNDLQIQHQKHREQLLPQRSVSKERYELPSHYQKYKDQAERIHLLTKKVGELLATATHLKSEHAKLKEDNELLKLEVSKKTFTIIFMAFNYLLFFY